MYRDPLYKQIEEGLESLHDGDLFERCANALLSAVYPSLTPVRGGNDGGYDGVAATSDGRAVLVCTISNDLAGNVRRNLRRTQDTGSPAPLVIVATSRTTTPVKRRSIEKLVRDEFGATVLGLHDGGDFADRLYRDPKWRLELLGLTGVPSALSPLPPRPRLFHDIPTVGRDAEMSWLRARLDRHALVIGQPGTGKTYVHEVLARESACVFAVSSDEARLSDDIRRLRPSLIVVDDAHVHLSRVEQLLRLRQELGAGYAIHANCWPRQDGALRSLLGLPEKNVSTLDKMSGKHIVELIQACGIGGPDELLQMLVHQADGKPGLAVELAMTCKGGDVRRVWSGDALADRLVSNPRVAPTPRHKLVLSAFAVGGDAGMRISDVATFWQMPKADVLDVVTHLAAGGIVDSVDTEQVQVRPAALRGALIRDAFYSEAPAVALDSFVATAHDPSACLEALSFARTRGAAVPLQLLRSLAAKSSAKGIGAFAWGDRECAQTVFDEWPDHLADAADALLHHLGQPVVERMLRRDAETRRPGNSSHPLRDHITQWLSEGCDDDPGRTLSRRRVLIDALKAQHKLGGLTGTDTYAWALGRVVSPSINHSKPVPGEKHSIRILTGLLPTRVLVEFGRLWPEVFALLRAGPIGPWKSFLEVVNAWCFPHRHRAAAEHQDLMDAARGQARAMLRDLLTLAPQSEALRAWVRHESEAATLGVDAGPHTDFEILFSDRDFTEPFEDHSKRRTAELLEYAKKLSSMDPAVVVSTLAGYEQDAARLPLDLGHDRWFMYKDLASLCADPVAYVRLLQGASFRPLFVSGFLQEALRRQPADGGTIAASLMDVPEYRTTAVEAVLSSGCAPPLVQRAIEVLIEGPVLDRYELARFLQQETVAVALLSCERKEIRTVSALAEWVHRRDEGVRPTVRSVWRDAFLECTGEDEYLIGKILESDEMLAHDWAARRVEETDQLPFLTCELLAKVVPTFSSSQRSDLIRRANPRAIGDGVASALVGTDPAMFAVWTQAHPEPYRALAPLRRQFDAAWKTLAIAALDQGVSAADIVENGMPRSNGLVHGLMSAHYRAQVSAFESLAVDPDPRFHAIGASGAQHARRDQASAERFEHAAGLTED